MVIYMSTGPLYFIVHIKQNVIAGSHKKCHARNKYEIKENVMKYKNTEIRNRRHRKCQRTNNQE